MAWPRKKEYERIFSLFDRQRWLKSTQLEAAFWELFESCGSNRQRELILELLERFHYVDGGSLQEQLDKLVEKITSDLNLPAEQTVVVASHPADDPDSAQWLVHMLKPRFERKEWRKVKIVNRMGKVTKYCVERPYVVVVDEFIGTGKTFSSRLKAIAAEVRAARKQSGGVDDDFEIYGIVLASTIQGLEVLQDEGWKVDAAILIDKGITDYYSGFDLHTAKNAMLEMEAKLQPSIDGELLPSFGYGGAEALYSVEGLNIPNSVFPVFWWRYLSNGTARLTFFDRLHGE